MLIRYPATFLYLFAGTALILGAQPLLDAVTPPRPPEPRLTHDSRRLAAPAPADQASLIIRPRSPLRSFRPDQALGAAIDGQECGEVRASLTPAHIRRMETAGLGPVSYRLRTELGCESWHWNPAGRWTQADHGYWTSSTHPGTPILISNGFRLPRRGNTIDQANNDGYSRLDDGNFSTFWKSNPYLDHHYTDESDALHAQWVVLDFGSPVSLDTLRVSWGVPYATAYQVQRWTGTDDVGDNDTGEWRTFPSGSVSAGVGGTVRIHLSLRPLKARFVRIRMTRSSHTVPPGATDVRDSLGYAIREISLGRIDSKGSLVDVVHHASSAARQTLVYVSSTDPWSRQQDQDLNTEQPGFDRMFRSGLTRGLPMMTPVSLAYGTPEDAVAELDYLSVRGYPIQQVELGEEPDGNFISPEDYGALFIQWARAIHRQFPTLRLGGPSLQSVELDFREWPDRTQQKSWLGRLVSYLRHRGRLSDLAFCSFEWYPIDNVCSPPLPAIVTAPARLKAAIRRVRASGLPASVPLAITEYGYSAFAAQAEVSLEGALFDADVVGGFLENTTGSAYLYGYEPNQLIHEVNCPAASANRSWGQNMLFGMDDSGVVKYRTAAYYAALLITTRWVQPGHGIHTLYASRWLGADPATTAYALRRPGGAWSILLVNKLPARNLDVHIRIESRRPVGAADIYQFGPAQYHWRPDRDRGYPDIDNPPHHFTAPAAGLIVRLPPRSITVVRLTTE